MKIQKISLIILIGLFSFWSALSANAASTKVQQKQIKAQLVGKTFKFQSAGGVSSKGKNGKLQRIGNLKFAMYIDKSGRSHSLLYITAGSQILSTVTKVSRKRISIKKKGNAWLVCAQTCTSLKRVQSGYVGKGDVYGLRKNKVKSIMKKIGG